ncbi:MAG TPA: hypothetical protein VGK14_11495 [Novimethylophilus sp.]|jgi:dihydroorotate dehydrogenase|uniref:hypothetical protein n=1 Tax=Novimethylophilus sp. TaxID=2137426 RepID=UPI002F424F38
MYKTLAALTSRLGAPHTRRLAATSIRLAGVVNRLPPPPQLRRSVMGLSFPAPLGLAAGFDKHGELYSALPGLGFGFAEIGTVTPLPETGRSRGLAMVIANLARHPAPRSIPLGVSIGMNRATQRERMADDYLACLAQVWNHADYIALNLGVRAGPDLHQPEHRAVLRSVLAAVKEEQARLTAASDRRLPIAVKVDQTRGNTDALLGCVRAFAFDGLILSGDALDGGGGRVLATLEQVSGALHGVMPVISVGGIRTPQHVQDRLNAGAALLQVYSGLVESGPLLVRRINRGLMPDQA